MKVNEILDLRKETEEGERSNRFPTWRWQFVVILDCSGIDCSTDRQKGCSNLCTCKSSCFSDLAPRSRCVRCCSAPLRREAGSRRVAEHALIYVRLQFILNFFDLIYYF